MSIDDDPFDYRITKSGVIVIGRGGRTVMELGGRPAAALIPKLGLSETADQQLLARATGNYRRGNERRSPRSK